MFCRAGRVLVVVLLAAAGAAPARECRADGSPAIVAAQPTTREKSGLSGGFGLGGEYAGLGVQIRYDVPLLPWLQVAPFLGAGWSSAGGGSNPFAGAAGLATGLGYRNRLAITLGVGPIFAEPLDLHGTVVDTKVVYGPSVLLGYERMIDTGFFQRIAIGYGWGLWGKTNAYSSGDIAFTLGTGMRLW